MLGRASNIKKLENFQDQNIILPFLDQKTQVVQQYVMTFVIGHFRFFNPVLGSLAVLPN